MSLCLRICVSVWLGVTEQMCPCVRESASVCVCFVVCLRFCVYVCVYVLLSVRASVCLCVRVIVWLCGCVFVCLCRVGVRSGGIVDHAETARSNH